MISGWASLSPLWPGSMATTLPDSPAADTRRLLEVVLVAVVDSVVLLRVLDGVVVSDEDDAVVDSVVRVVVLVGGSLVVLWVVGEVVVVGAVLVEVAVLGWVTGRSGIRVRAALEVGGSRPGTVTCALADAPPSAEVRAVDDAVVADGADRSTALPQAASNRTVMPWPAAISALRRLG